MMRTVIYLSFATAAISFTVTETALFKPVRERMMKMSRFLGQLVSCGYCFGYWTALALTLIYKPVLFTLWRLLDLFLTALVIAWFSGFQWALMCLLMDKAKK